MENKELWEKIEDAKRKNLDVLEIRDENGDIIRINIMKKEWLGDVY